MWEAFRGARTPFNKRPPSPPTLVVTFCLQNSPHSLLCRTPHSRQNPLGHRVSEFKIEVMLNRWSKYYCFRIPAKLNFDFSLSIMVGFYNLLIKVDSAGWNLRANFSVNSSGLEPQNPKSFAELLLKATASSSHSTNLTPPDKSKFEITLALLTLRAKDDIIQDEINKQEGDILWLPLHSGSTLRLGNLTMRY